MRLSSRALLAFVVSGAVAFSGTRPAVEQQFEALRNSPPGMYAFLLRMPKGADLHNHLAGAVYAETYLSEAAADGLCIDRRTFSIVLAPCTEASLPASDALKNGDVYSRAVDSLSMRDFVPGIESAHDHFFDTFDKFRIVSHFHEGEAIAEVVRRAASQNESYLELMALTSTAAISKLRAPAWSDDLEVNRKNWMDAGMADAVASLKQRVDELETDRKKMLGCDSDPSSPACKVIVRYILQVLRESPKERVFAQTLAGFLLASQDGRVVAVNYVQPEDGLIAMRDYDVHMHFVAYLHAQFPQVHISLHAGELAPGLVPPEGLRFHIREAVDVAHAERIGHGVSIAYENDSAQTMKHMAAAHIAVEINLTSNDVILGVKGKDHPFDLYRHYGVPLAICTDDEGVSRTHLTEEYLRAVETYGLRYPELKRLVRNSIEYSFLAAEDKTKALADLDRRFATFEDGAR